MFILITVHILRKKSLLVAPVSYRQWQ